MSSSAISGLTIIDFPAGMIMPYAGSSTPAGWLECNGAEVDISAYPSLSAALGTTWNNAKNPLTGATYASPAAGKFRLPDLRGSFLRGSSGGANNAQGVATGLAEFQTHKTAKNGLTATSGTSNLSALTMNSSSISLTMNSSSVSGSATSGGIDHTHTAGIYRVTADFSNGTTGLIRNGGAATPSSYGTAEASSGASAYNHTHGLSATAAAQTLSTGSAAAQTVSSSTVAAPAITIGAGDAETRPDAVGVRYLIKI